jgi:predicted  nucleic acid-binding Zn-ribbon protein
MEKLSSEKIAAVLNEVPGTLRALCEERDQWQERAKTAETQLAKIAQDQRIAKLASEMERKGLDRGRSAEDRIAALQKKASEGKLDLIEEAVKMSSAQRSMGELVDAPSGGGAVSEFEAYLMDGSN